MPVQCPCRIFLVAKLLYKLGGNMILSATIYDRALNFSVHIPIVYEHLFYKYFLHRSVGQATNGKSASLLMAVVILV